MSKKCLCDYCGVNKDGSKGEWIVTVNNGITKIACPDCIENRPDILENSCSCEDCQTIKKRLLGKYIGAWDR
jgi:hypothetical protein